MVCSLSVTSNRKMHGITAEISFETTNIAGVGFGMLLGWYFNLYSSCYRWKRLPFLFNPNCNGQT
jgi:hypothetical protein